MQLSNKQKVFSQLCAEFLKSTLNFQSFEKNMTLIAYVFPKLKIAKDMVRKKSKKPSFRTLFQESIC